jgi:hypothetical protein
MVDGVHVFDAVAERVAACIGDLLYLHIMGSKRLSMFLKVEESEIRVWRNWHKSGDVQSVACSCGEAHRSRDST